MVSKTLPPTPTVAVPPMLQPLLLLCSKSISLVLGSIVFVENSSEADGASVYENLVVLAGILSLP